MERLQDGDHACMAYTEDAARWQALTVFTWTGLANGQRVLLVLDPDDLRDDEVATQLDGGTGRVEAARATGQLALQRSTSFYFSDGRRDLADQRNIYLDAIMRARRDGWSGLRGAGSVNWAPARGWGAGEVADFESSVSPVFADGSFTAICWYDRRLCNDYLVAAAKNVHPIQIMDRLNAIEVTAAPDGAPPATPVVVFARGELTETLAVTLDRLAGGGASHFELDLTDLSFMEAHVAVELISFAAALPEGSSVTVRSGPVLALLLRACGADTVAQLRLVAGEEAYG